VKIKVFESGGQITVLKRYRESDEIGEPRDPSPEERKALIALCKEYDVEWTDELLRTLAGMTDEQRQDCLADMQLIAAHDKPMQPMQSKAERNRVKSLKRESVPRYSDAEPRLAREVVSQSRRRWTD
jgi:hypothetical protein